MKTTVLTANDVLRLARDLSLSIQVASGQKRECWIYGVPRGGVPAAIALVACNPEFFKIVDKPQQADYFIDDIVDSGATRKKYEDKYEKPLFALVDRESIHCEFKDGWIVFPWEGEATTGIEDNIRRLLEYCGENAMREGLLETPKRVAKAWAEWCGGYGQDPESVMKVFSDGAEKCDQMVIVKDIPLYSHCEHHMAAIIGVATIAYIPNGKIVGLSKLSRLVDIYAKRLQVQERLTNQIADAIEKYLEPRGVGVVVKARHMCMESRGVCKQGHHTITSALRGVIKECPDSRAEFMELAK